MICLNDQSVWFFFNIPARTFFWGEVRNKNPKKRVRRKKLFCLEKMFLTKKMFLTQNEILKRYKVFWNILLTENKFWKNVLTRNRFLENNFDQKKEFLTENKKPIKRGLKFFGEAPKQKSEKKAVWNFLRWFETKNRKKVWFIYFCFFWNKNRKIRKILRTLRSR